MDRDSALLRCLSAAAYREAVTENETDDVNEEAVRDHSGDAWRVWG